MVKKTDWDNYYRRPFKATTITRRITASRLIRYLLDYAPSSNSRIVEFGGANSCFIDSVCQALKPSEYCVADNNRLGLDLLKARRGDFSGLVTIQEDILEPVGVMRGDIAFSVGLIEHFDVSGTSKAIRRHFDAVQEGGLVVITFPTPTWLYRITRWCAEKLGVWIFYDERPLRFDEVSTEMARYGEFLARDLIWPIFLTQGVLVFRKKQV